MLPAPPPRSSALAHWLEPFAAGLWILFLLWTGGIAVLWTSGIGEAEITALGHPELRAALLWLLPLADPAWVALAAGNVYVAVAAEHGLATARRWACLILGATLGLGAVSAWRDWPLGPIHFTNRLGPRLGPIPFGLPLLWLAVLLGARDVLGRFAPRASHGQIALGTGVLAALTDLNLEPVAWKARAFWLWYPAQLPAPGSPPIQNYATWLIAGALLAFLLREPTVVRSAARNARPAITFCLVNAVFLATNAARVLAR